VRIVRHEPLLADALRDGGVERITLLGRRIDDAKVITNGRDVGDAAVALGMSTPFG